MKIRHQKRKCRTDKERYFHIINKQRLRKQTDILHADFSRSVCAVFFVGNDQRLCEPSDIDDKRYLIVDRFVDGNFIQENLPVKRVTGWFYNDRFNPYDF